MASKNIPAPKKMSGRKTARKSPGRTAPAPAPIVIGTPVSELGAIIKKIAQEREDQVFDGALAMAGNTVPAGSGMEMLMGSPNGMAFGMAMQHLISLEEGIISSEWYESRGVSTIYPSAEAISRYAAARSKADAKFGAQAIDEALVDAKVTHNYCARENLDRSGGLLYCYVLPKFNSDGTHEPVGPKDVPWNQTK